MADDDGVAHPVCGVPECEREANEGGHWCTECILLRLERWARNLPRTGTCIYGSCSLPQLEDKPWCAYHYSKRVERRFRAKVRKIPYGCWEWTGWIVRTGYGSFSVRGRRELAHRWAYEHWVGPIPTGFHLHHRCGNKSCVKPRHLEPLSPGDHRRRHRLENR